MIKGFLKTLFCLYLLLFFLPEEEKSLPVVWLDSVPESLFKKILMSDYPQDMEYKRGLPQKGDSFVASLRYIHSVGETFQGEGVISREYLAPVTEFNRPLYDVSLKESLKFKLLPVTDITLPQKALSVEGLYPTDPGYPLVNEEHFFLENCSQDSDGRRISRWYREFLEGFTLDSPPEVQWVGGVGDIMPGRGVEKIFRESGGVEKVFTDTLDILREQDLLTGNLEGAVTTRGTQFNKSFTFRFPPDVLKGLKSAGFDYLGLSNNHIYDYGEVGLKDTLVNLKKYEIGTSGAGLTEAEASAWYENRGVRILSIAAFPRERNGYDGIKESLVNSKRAGILYAGELTDRAVESMCSPETFDILHVHGGKEWSSVPVADQRALYRKYVDMGADLILGHHPHVLQEMEVWKGRLIAYSLGNFVFPLMKGWYTAEETMILSVGVVDNRILYIKDYPVRIDNRVIQRDTSGAIRKRLYSMMETPLKE